MCDTLVATPKATARKGVLFAKNSDRERNEAQGLEQTPRRAWSAGDRLALTYIEIDQAPLTHACLLSRPYWMWGAEMGANEHGVVIGNEAMQSVVPAARRPALTGMDLVRLGLERARTAAEAVAVITALLERHGQGGNCGHLNRFYYHNGFIIADPGEAYVLETVGRWWIVERVQGARTLSNALSISGRPHALSAALAAHARAEGWCGEDGGFDFAGRLIDPAKDAATFGRGRCARSAGLLAPAVGRLALADLIGVLRDHGAEADGVPDWSPRLTRTRSICMHAAHGARRSQSVASMASDLSGPTPIHWVTGTSAPCLSLFKPVLLGGEDPGFGPAPSGRFDPASLWWRHEPLHRAALHDFPQALGLIAAQRDATEQGFRARIDQAQGQGPVALAQAVRACWDEAAVIEADWARAVAAARTPGASALGRPAAVAWARLNRAAGLSPAGAGGGRTALGQSRQ